MTQLVVSRRDLIVKSTRLTAAGVAVLAGIGTASFGRDARGANPSGDVDTLNVALGLEHQAIGAYQVGADSGLLKQPALNIALLFQSHHKAHRDALIAAIQKLGGTPVPALTTGEYAKSLNAAAIKSQEDILRLALGLELGATKAYIGVIPVFENRDLAKVCGGLAADEAMHWTALQSALGQPLPVQAFSFGS